MRDQIIQLAKEGMKRTEIARTLSISKIEVLAVLCSIPSFFIIPEYDQNIEKEMEYERIIERQQIEEEQDRIFEIVHELRKKKMSSTQITNYLNVHGFRNSWKGKISNSIVKKIMTKVGAQIGKTG